MSGIGKVADSKHYDGGAQDCDSCGNRDHVQQASKGDKTKAIDAAQASGDRVEKSGDILGP